MKQAKPLIIFVGAIALLIFIYVWGFCRIYVAPGQMAVIIAKTGKPLPAGQILAGPGQKGIRSEVLGEGRHFRDPILYQREIHKLIPIPPGKVGILTAKVGADLPEGEFLADENQKGIRRSVLGPGKYRLNPYGYRIDVVDAISIPIGYAGVITSLSGEQMTGAGFAGANEKGVRKDILQPGLYYVNPKQYKTDIVEIGVNQVSMLGKAGVQLSSKTQLDTKNVAMQRLQSNALEQQKQKRWNYLSRAVKQTLSSSRQQEGQAQQIALDRAKREFLENDSASAMVVPEFVEFPSRDGFQISIDMSVEIEMLPSDIAGIFSRYGDLPQVLDKILIPQITSISRNKGSEYGAKDFIVGEGREKFQTELTKSLATTLGAKKIIVHNALIRHVAVPTEIRQPIQQASIAVEQNLTNLEKQNTAKKLAQLNTEITLIEQRKQQVAQETEKIKAEIKADEEKQVAEIQATAIKKVAEIAKKTAGIDADTIRIIAVAEADAMKMVEGEKAKGLQLKIGAYGDPVAYNMKELADKLKKDVKINIIHTGEGTLWTDLEKANAGELGGAVIMRKNQKK